MILLGLGFASSCKDDSTSTDNDKSTGLLSDATKKKLYDKVWYSTSSAGGIDHEFLSDGTLRLSQSLDGRWTWRNEGDTMDCVDNTNSKFSYLFTSIGDHSMSFKSSIDGYSNTYSYKDTE